VDFVSREQTKIKARDVMPEILELLKHERRVETASIGLRMRAVAASKQLMFRQEAISFSLTVLKTHGWASNPKRGMWCVTQVGSKITLSKDQVDALGREIWGS
jgi:restriction endonuclease Mrr